MRFPLFAPICELQMATLTIATNAAEHDRQDVADFSRTGALNAVKRARAALDQIEAELSSAVAKAA